LTADEEDLTESDELDLLQDDFVGEETKYDGRFLQDDDNYDEE